MVLQEALGQTWVLFDMTVLAAMLMSLITYSVSVQSLRDFSPQQSYEVYDSLGGAQARLLLPKKNVTALSDGEWHSYVCACAFVVVCPSCLSNRPCSSL